MVGGTPTSDGRDWTLRMATTPTNQPANHTIDLTEPMITAPAHRLAELVQALTGCSVERAEMAVSDPIPVGPASVDHALTTMAQALVRLRIRQPA